MSRITSPRFRVTLAVSAVAVLAGCVTPEGRFDWDLRGPGAGSTAEAARAVTAPRPRADSRGVISYPGYQVVVAQRGDTVQGLVGRLGINATDLARSNAIPHDASLNGGEVLVLPRRVAEPSPATGGIGTILPPSAAPGASTTGVDVGAIATTALDRVAPPAPAAPARAAPVQTGAEPLRHRVARGETAFIIARRYNIPVRALVEWNGLNANMDLREGQTLLIPPTADAPAPARTAAAAPPPGAGFATPEPPSATRPLPAETPQRAGGGAAEGTPPAPNLPTSANARLAMPADGRVIRAYERKKYDGIGIGAAAGSPVRAAADGTVVTVTRDTSSVPIVMLRHDSGLMTIYANVDDITVAKDARVKRGQQIGKVRAGDPPFLHFEVRRGVDSVDPMTLLQ